MTDREEKIKALISLQQQKGNFQNDFQPRTKRAFSLVFFSKNESTIQNSDSKSDHVLICFVRGKAFEENPPNFHCHIQVTHASFCYNQLTMGEIGRKEGQQQICSHQTFLGKLFGFPKNFSIRKSQKICHFCLCNSLKICYEKLTVFFLHNDFV